MTTANGYKPTANGHELTRIKIKKTQPQMDADLRRFNEVAPFASRDLSRILPDSETVNLGENEITVIQKSVVRAFGINIDRSGLHLRKSAFICGGSVPYSRQFVSIRGGILFVSIRG